MRAGRKNERLSEIDIARITFDAEWAARQIDFVDVVSDKPGADMGRLLLHLFHEPGALDHVGEAWIVLDISRDGELAARSDPLNEDRIEHSAGRIDAGRVAGGP